MLIRARMGMSADGFVATPDGLPALRAMPGFVPGASHGHPEFIASCDALAMGRTTFWPAIGAPRWPWPGRQVYVLTSSPLPPGTLPHVIAVSGGPAGLVKTLRSRGSDGDVHLAGGPQTIRALLELGALDRLEILIPPILLGAGVPLSPPGSTSSRLRLLGADRTFEDGTIEIVYAPAEAPDLA